MSGPHVTSIRYFVIGLLLSGGLVHLAPSVARAQGPATGSSTDLDRGVELYERGDASDAIDALRKGASRCDRRVGESSLLPGILRRIA